MDTQKILDALPAVYRGLLPPFFAEEIPLETAATCSDCAMISPTHAGELVRSFSAKSKCCTHWSRRLSGRSLPRSLWPCRQKWREPAQRLSGSGDRKQLH